jgi:peptide/nickel transport system ATP-binding protein
MSLCWLADDVLAKMEPVIKFDKEHAAHEGVPEDAHGTGLGSTGTAPNRPRGKSSTAEADAIGDAVEQGQAGMRARRHKVSDESSETGVKKPKDTTRRH